VGGGPAGHERRQRDRRRYHWLSEGLTSFVDDPARRDRGPGQGEIVNLADRRADASRDAQLELLASWARQAGAGSGSPLVRRRAGAPAPAEPLLPHLVMPDHHDVRAGDVILRRLHGTLAAAADAGPKDFPELLLVPGVGARTVRSLAMVAEVIHGAPCRFADPARFSLAHGGKDRHPFPVPTKVYDKTIGVLKAAVEQAKLGQDEKLGAIRRLDEQARRLERHATGSTTAAMPNRACSIGRRIRMRRIWVVSRSSQAEKATTWSWRMSGAG
jgi:hypothetical protein